MDIQAVLGNLSTNPLISNQLFNASGVVIGYLGFFVGLLSLGGMVYLYFKGKKDKEPTYTQRSINIFKGLSEKLESLEISYEGKKVKNLTITKIAFWNKGKGTIKREDIVPSDPLTFEVADGYQILSIKIFPNNKSNKFTYSTSDDLLTAKLDFDYLDENDGAIIQISHTGESGKDIRLKGKIMGTGPLLMKEDILLNFFSLSDSSKKTNIFKGRFTILEKRKHFGIFFILMSIIYFSFPFYPPGIVETYNATPVPFYICGLIMLIMGIMCFKSVIPKSLEQFYND